MKHKDRELQYQEWRDTKEETPKIKTNIKMRVTPEQSKKVQEICFKSGINWGFNDNRIRYTEEPFIVIKNSLSWLGNNQKDFFNNNGLEEINAQLFIKTNGTYIEKEEFKYPMWFKNKNHKGLIVRFDDIDAGTCIASSSDILDDWEIGERYTRIVEHTNKDFWEQIESPNEHLDRLDDIVDEAIKEVSVDINEEIKEVVSDGSKNKFYEIPDWIKDLDDLSEYLNLDPYEFNILKTLWMHKGKRHNGTNELRELNKRLHYAEKSKEKYLRSEKDKE